MPGYHLSKEKQPEYGSLRSFFSGELDKAIAAFIIANGAAAYDHEVTIFCTFWGLNALRKDEDVLVKKGFLENMFAKMMPRGADKLGTMTMDLLGLQKEELLEGVEYAGVAAYLGDAADAKVNLFI
ncbi:DsrE/DsrF/DrsH-like family protein [Paenibacillus sp.]|uniref:DsrE/DsrF/DrsH-like family protein n=1 Tax=Paenibacillus sp. TaxID=58172 RepID=UPI00356783F5